MIGLSFIAIWASAAYSPKRCITVLKNDILLTIEDMGILQVLHPDRNSNPTTKSYICTTNGNNGLNDEIAFDIYMFWLFLK